jgi:MFS family permease
MKKLLTANNHAFLKLIAYRFQMVLAYQMIAVAVGWHIYQITRDPLSLGLIGLAEVVTYFCCALFAGHAVDHHCSRRFFASLASVMLVINALFLTIVAAGLLDQYINTNITYFIYGAIAFTGIARAFISPSYNTLFALIIPRENFANASGLGSSLFQSGQVIGPALGGLLIGFASISATYCVASLLFLGAAISIWLLKIDEPKPKNDDVNVLASIAEGLRFVFNKQILLAASALDMFAVLFGGAVALLPAFIHDIYQLGPESLGILRASPAIGAIMVGFWLAKHPININTGKWLLATVAGFGVCMIGFGLAQSFWIAMIMLFLSGVFDGVSVVLRQTILQLATPDAMRGRVSAINGIFIGSSNEIGAFESGLAARFMGLVPAVVFGGLMTISVVGVTAKFAPQLRKLDLQQLH